MDGFQNDAPAVKTSSKLKHFLRRCAERFEKIRAEPRAVTGGAAIGMFWAFTPLTGLKTALSVLFAWIFRCSKVSAALAVTVHDVLSPIWPVFLRWEYVLGFWILSHPHHFPERLGMMDTHLKDWLCWKTLEIIWPTFVGSLLFAVPSAVLTYWLVGLSLRHHRTVRKESKVR